MKIGVLLTMISISSILAVISPLEADWKAVDAALRDQKVRTAVKALEQIETKAAAQQLWSEYAAATLRRTQLENGYTEENVLDRERKEGLSAKFAAKVESAPAEVRPMLRIALVHHYVEQSRSARYWQANRTQIASAANTNQPPWSAERLRPTLRELFAKIMADAPRLQSEKVGDWGRLLSSGDELGDTLQPTLLDFAVADMVKLVGENSLFDHDEKGAPIGLAADVLAAIDARIAFHSADTNAHALAFAKLAKIDFLDAATEGRPKEKRAQRMAALKAFATEQRELSWVSGLAAARLCEDSDLDEDLDLDEDGRTDNDLVALRDWYWSFAKRWPKTPGGDACRFEVQLIEQPDFSVTTEGKWTAPAPDLAITYKNLTNMTFRLVRLTVDDLAEHDDFDMSPARYSDYLREYFKRKVVKEWTVDLPPQSDFRNHEHRVKVPLDVPKGHYALFAIGADHFTAGKRDVLPTVVRFITVTDLAIVTDGSGAKGSGYLLDGEQGTPVAGATVELWTCGGGDRECVESTTTKEDGAFAFSDRKDRWACALRAVKDGDEVIANSISIHRPDAPKKPCPEHVELVTDRAIYRPGQTVKFKGFAFHCDPEKRDYRAIADRRVFVTLVDPNNKQVAQLALISNAFGSFSGEFIVPRGLLTGNYFLQAELRASQSVATTRSVRVEEYKRPKFMAKLNPMQEAQLGSEATVTGVATTYTGLPVPEAEVKWTVTRKSIYPSWWYWDGNDDEPVFASGTAKTDAKGEFKIVFTPQPSKTADLDGDPSFRFMVNANVTDGTGESHAAVHSFEVGTVPWRASVYPRTAEESGKWFTPATPVTVKAGLCTLNGEPVGQVKGAVKVYALKGPDQVVRKPLDAEYPWYRRPRPQPGLQATRLWDATTWPNGPLVGEYPLTTDEKGNAETGIKLACGIYRAEYQVTAPNGKIVKDFCTWRVIDPASEGHAIKEPIYTELEKSLVPVGGLVRLYWGTGYDRACCRVIVRQGEKILHEEIRRESMFCFDLPITADMVGQLEIETLCLRENRLMANRFNVNVPRPDSNLVLTRKHFTSKLLPGAQETWSFTVSGGDTNDVRSKVEMLALMYDRSLDEFAHHQVWLPFEQYFGRRTSYRSWFLNNQRHNLEPWQGDWPTIRSVMGYRLRRWQSNLYASFGGGLGRRYAMKAGASMRVESVAKVGAAAPAGMAVDACEEAVGDVVVMCCEAVAPQAPTANAFGGSVRSGLKAESNAKLSVTPRKNLAETAFFLPHLMSDEKGAVTFTFTVPEALTGWKFMALAHDAELRGGIFRDDKIVTTKPLMVEPVAPRFVREGDSFRFPVKVTNTEAKEQRGECALEFFDAESGQSVPLGQGGGQAFELGANEAKTVEFAVAIPDGCRCLRYVAKAVGKEFADGEEGFLPVLSKRVEVRESLPLQIKKAGVRSAKFKELLASGESKTLRHAGLAVQVVSDPTWYAFLALPYLMEYPHECCEQVFGRFYANALAQHIARSRPAYREVFDEWEQLDAKAVKSPLELNGDLKQIALEATPWVREAADETKAKRHLGELFGSARLEREQWRAVEKLQQNFNGGDRLWPWFPGGPGSAWVTMHILTGYARLDRLVGDPKLVVKPNQLPLAQRGLDAEMVRIIDERLALIKKLKGEFQLSSMDLRWLYLHSFYGGKSKHTPMLMKHLRKEWTSFGIAGQSLAAIVLQRAGEKKLARTIVQSLKERAVRSEEFGLYWKRSAFFDCSLFAAPVCDQALAMEAFREVTPGDRVAYEDARLWMLEQKRTQNWSTTVATVDAVYAILMGGTGKVAVSAKNEDVVTVRLGGVELPREGVEAGTGFYEHRFASEQITAKLGEVEMARKTDTLGWVSLNWTYLEDATKVNDFEQRGLRLTKTYFKKTLVEGKVRLVPLGGGEMLRPGDELVARLAIDSDRVYEYAHLRDERPASAEPVDVLSRYRWQDGLGFYQSTRDTATHYYFDRLPKGNFVLETSFRVRQQGTFSSGLASLQCMYAPEFGAHSNATVIEVKK